MKLKFGTTVTGSVESSTGLGERLGIHSIWEVEHLRRIRSGYLYKWKTLSHDFSHNIVTDEGINNILNIHFFSVAKISNWYIAIFEDDYTPLITNTYAVPGYTESTAYTEGTRAAYVGVAATGKIMTNVASRGTFTMNATKTIYGGALVSVSTKNDKTAGANTNILFNASKFSTPKSVVDTDVLKVGIEINGADA